MSMLSRMGSPGKPPRLGEMSSLMGLNEAPRSVAPWCTQAIPIEFSCLLLSEYDQASLVKIGRGLFLLLSEVGRGQAIDGLGDWQGFRHGLLPQLAPVLELLMGKPRWNIRGWQVRLGPGLGNDACGCRCRAKGIWTHTQAQCRQPRRPGSLSAAAGGRLVRLASATGTVPLFSPALSHFRSPSVCLIINSAEIDFSKQKL